MTRDQAEKIAKAVMDEIETSRMISKDRLTDAIFNCWHKGTADQYRIGIKPLHYSTPEYYSEAEWQKRQWRSLQASPAHSTIDMQLDD